MRLHLVLSYGLPCRGVVVGQGRGFGDDAIFWSLTRHTWIELHDRVAVALVVIVIIHLVLHWKWIVYMTNSFFKKKP
ncbi:DUF4405 domain-containing protein [Chloroflexota bacterium]